MSTALWDILHSRICAGPASASSSGRDLHARYLTAICWSTAGLVVARGATFVASVFTARILGADSFGGFTIVQSTASVGAMLAGAGLGITASRHVAESRERDPQRVGRILGLSSAVALVCGALLAVALVGGATFVAEHVLRAPALATPLRIGGFLVLFTALNGYQTGALAGLEAFRTMAKVNFWSGIISCPVIIFATYRGGIRGAMWGLSAGMAVTWALNHISLRHACADRGINWTWRNCWAEADLIHRTSVPALLSSLIVVPGMWLCNYWVIQQAGGFQQLGLYGAADRYRLLLLFVPSAIAGSVLPILSNFRGDGNSSGFRRLLRLNVLVVLTIVSVPALLIALCAGRAMGYFGASYVAGAPVLSVLCFSAIAESLNTAVGQAVLTASAWRRLFFDVMLTSIICGTAFLLVPQHGALGLAFAYLTGFACTATALVLYVRRARIRSMEVPHFEVLS